MMDGDVEDLLGQGIAAAKRGEIELSRDIFLRVIAIEEENEGAWLWLSSVVESDEDRAICLRNVLFLNPDSEPAQRGLERIGQVQPEDIAPLFPNSKETTPVSPASSILYPERYQEQWHWEDNTPLQIFDVGEIKIRSDYDDVWEKEYELCAYCAQEIEPDQKKCPNCRRKLKSRSLRYPLSSQELTMFWVLLIGVAELLLLQAVIEIIVRDPIVSVVWHGLLFLVVIGLVAGVVLRQTWALPASIVFLLVLFVAMFIGFIAGIQPDEAIASVVGDDLVSLLSSDYDSIFMQSLLTISDILRFAMVALALLYGILKIGPDFERIQTRYVARVDRGLSDDSMYYARGKAYADQGMWASAILHWRLAAAKDPARAYYQRILGEAYAHLGYYERSLDVLKSAVDRTLDPGSQERLMAFIDEVKDLQAADELAIGADRK